MSTITATPATITAHQMYLCYKCMSKKPADQYPPPKRPGAPPLGYCTECVKRDAYFRQSSCLSKEKYCNEHIANEAARIADMRRSTRLRSYPCEFGDHWHITSHGVDDEAVS